VKEFRLCRGDYNDLQVLDRDGFPYLMARRRSTLFNGMNTKVCMGRKLVLETNYIVFLFRVRIKMKIQDLPKPVSLIRHEGDTAMMVGSDLITIQQKVYSDPRFRLFKNGQEYGQVLKADALPDEKRIVFNQESDDNVYFLVFLMAYIPPIAF
jgi:hypothetical protein